MLEPIAAYEVARKPLCLCELAVRDETSLVPPAISIVVTSFTLQRLPDVKALISSLSKQEAMNFELVYVTEGDKRLYHVILEEVKDKHFKTKIAHNDGRLGLSEARNLGTSLAGGKIVGFVDDDVTLDPSWSKEVEKAFESHSEIVALTGPALPTWDGPQAKWFPLELDWLIGCTRWTNYDMPVSVRNCWGMNMAFRRDLLTLVGGFSPDSGFVRGRGLNLLGEDLKLSLRIRQIGKIGYFPRVRVANRIHMYRLTTRYIVERALWIGRTRALLRNEPSDSSISQELVLLRAILWGMVSQPFHSRESLLCYIKRLRVTLLAVSAVAIGYLVAMMG